MQKKTESTEEPADNPQKHDLSTEFPCRGRSGSAWIRTTTRRLTVSHRYPLDYRASGSAVVGLGLKVCERVRMAQREADGLP